MSVVAISLGSNLGDRRAHLAWAVERLAGVLEGMRVSAAIETAPFDVPAPQPPYLNLAVVGETALSPQALMAELLAIERQRGRTRTASREPRTLDLDLILYDDLVLAADAVQVPHPRFRARRFVLEPLTEIAPELRDPLTGKTMKQLLLDVKRVESDGHARDDAIQE